MLFMLGKIIIGILLFIFFFSFLQFLISIHPPRFTDQDVPSNYELEYENISVMTEDGIEIKAWLIQSKKANGTIIIGHGYPFSKGNILPVAKFLYPDYNLIYYDHRYFGESSGYYSTVGLKEVQDVDAIITFTREKFDKQPIALYGFSLSASAMLMSKEKVNAIIADSPYGNLEMMVHHIYAVFGPLRYPFVVVTNLFSKLFFGVYPQEISPAIAIQNSSTPILLIHGEKDSQIPIENAYLLQESNPDIDVWIVPGADHGQAHALERKAYEKRVKEFLRKNMK